MKTRIILSLVVAFFVSVFALNLSETANAGSDDYDFFVRNSSNQIVQGATVELVGKSYYQILTSDSQGRVRFTNVIQGTYSVTACYQGTGKMYQDIELPDPGAGTNILVLEPNVTFCPSW